MPSVAALTDDFLTEFFALHPIHATNAGMHDHDGRWPDLTDAGRLARIAFAERWTAALTALPETEQGVDDAIDRDLLLGELAAIRFAEAELREEAWSPLAWLYLIGGGLHPLIALDFAPLADRLTSLAGRAAGIPAVLDAARDELGSIDGRPVARLHTEATLERWDGLASILDDAVALAAEASSEPAVAAVQPRLEAAVATARTALAEFEVHLRDAILPRSEGDGRLGPGLFAAKMAHTLQSDLPAADLHARASREFEAVRAEMIRIARDIAPRWLGSGSLPDDDGALVRAVLDAIAVEHPRPDELLDVCRAELERIEVFCRDRNLIGLVDEPLEIRWTPVFLRSSGGALLHSPGPLDVGQKAFFSITPVDDGKSPEEVESELREDNDRMLRLLTIHEAVPGHYLQGVYQNRCPAILRSIFWSGVFAEGWAVYVTQVMIDAGYGADDPALLLTHWKFYLRTVINALIDIDIHTAGMTEDEAVRLMVDGGFQEDAAARGKYERARLSSTQLSTYFVGSAEFWDLELEARKRAAIAAGDPRGANAVPAPHLVGGLGATPGFDRRAHLEACLSHGSPPMRLLRRLVLGS